MQNPHQKTAKLALCVPFSGRNLCLKKCPATDSKWHARYQGRCCLTYVSRAECPTRSVWCSGLHWSFLYRNVFGNGDVSILRSCTGRKRSPDKRLHARSKNEAHFPGRIRASKNVPQQLRDKKLRPLFALIIGPIFGPGFWSPKRAVSRRAPCCLSGRGPSHERHCVTHCVRSTPAHSHALVRSRASVCSRAHSYPWCL